MDIITAFCILGLCIAILIIDNRINKLSQRVEDIVIIVEKLSKATKNIYQSNLRSEQNIKEYIDDRFKKL